MFNIKIYRLNGEYHSISFNNKIKSKINIKMLKMKIFMKTGIPIDIQRIIFKEIQDTDYSYLGFEYDDNKMLSDLHYTNESKFTLILRLNQYEECS